MQQVARIALAHGLHQFVLEQPGGFAGHAKLAFERQGADGVLVLGEQVHGQEPQPQGQVGVLHHRAHDAGGLVATDQALPQLAAAAVAGEEKAFAGAARTSPAVGPAGNNKRALTLRFGAVERLEVGTATDRAETGWHLWTLPAP